MKRYTLPAILWSVLVTVLCLLPGKDLPPIHIVNLDKVFHCLFFGILNWFYLRWASIVVLQNVLIKFVLITSAVIGYGGLMEILQGSFYSDRMADIYDFLANAVGCLLALLIIQKQISRKLKESN